MTSWSTFQQAEPELAARAHAILSSTTNCVLGTIRADGTPRLSGIDPWFTEGELWFGSMPDARKGADIARDPRIALHGIPWESRKIKEGAIDPGDGDVKLTGRAVEITDAAVQAKAMAHFLDGRDDIEEEPEVGGLYRIEIDSIVLISVADDQLVIDRWSAEGGRTVVRRD